MHATTFKGWAGISSILFFTQCGDRKMLLLIQWYLWSRGVAWGPRPVSMGPTFQHPCSFVNSSSEAALAFNPRVNHRRPESRTALLHFHWGIWLIGGVTKNFCAKVVRRVIRLSNAGSERNNKLDSLPLSAVTQNRACSRSVEPHSFLTRLVCHLCLTSSQKFLFL